MSKNKNNTNTNTNDNYELSVDRNISALVPVFADNEVREMLVNVGEKEITAVELKRSVVTARTLIEYANISTMCLACEMGKLSKADVEKEGFKSVISFVKTAFGSRLDENTISRYYKIGRVFGDAYTHKWRKGIPADVSITNLGVCLSLLPKDVDVSKLSDDELDVVFNEFYDIYVDTEKIHLRNSLKGIREEVKIILHPEKADIPVKAEEVDSDENSDENSTQTDENSGESMETIYNALDVLMTYFKGNDRAMDALTALYAELPEQHDVETENA